MKKLKYVLVAGIFLIAVLSGVFYLQAAKEPIAVDKRVFIFAKDFTNSDFRNTVIRSVRGNAEGYFEKQAAREFEELKIRGDWDINIKIYYQGEIKGQGREKDEILLSAIEEATKNALDSEGGKSLNQEKLKNARFLVEFWGLGENPFSFIEYNDEGKEIIDNLAIVRELDKELILEKIKQGKEYLFRIIDKEKQGAHKYYYAIDDSFENRLHTIYTSSLIYTLLKIYDFEKDERIWQQILDSGEFILSMQNLDKKSEEYGAFHYSYFLDSRGKEEKFVVGTASKTIFTLLELYKRTGDSKYLESAKLAANWLIIMQNSDGGMKSYVKYKENGKKTYSKKESFLYNGQVLSALSRIYRTTEEKKYYNVAEKIARYTAAEIEENGCYIGDDYRGENPISSSWAVLSLLDFYKTNEDDYYKKIVFDCSGDLLERQIKKDDDVLNYGRWKESHSTSGCGWLAEVMAEMHKFCEEEGNGGCDKYQDAITLAIRWLLQNTYSKENSFLLKNPERANGGLFWNQESRHVRTDSVCHGLNAYVGIIGELEEGTLVSIPEKPLDEIFGGLKEIK